MTNGTERSSFLLEQVDALLVLESALRRCRRSGLAFVGMDDSLLAFDGVSLNKAGWQVDSHKSMKACGQGYKVKTAGSYRDSGGW